MAACDWQDETDRPGECRREDSIRPRGGRPRLNDELSYSNCSFNSVPDLQPGLHDGEQTPLTTDETE